MKNLKFHRVFKISLLLLVIALLLPSAIKFSHVFEDHRHEICEYPQKLHYHDFELDCEFYKFKLSTAFSFTTPLYEILCPSANKGIIVSQYESISDFQKKQTTLRGPPSII